MNERQKAIYEKIQELLNAGEPIPSASALGKMFGMSQQAMSKNLKVLEEENYIRRTPRKHRSIELVEAPPQAYRVRLLGRIAAGCPLEAIEEEQTIDVPMDLVPKGDIYALEVSGNSMIEDGIWNGDVVIVRRQSIALNGQTVVAVVNGEATLKRYYHEGSQIRLQPANAALQPIYVHADDEFEVRGVVQALYRKFAKTAVGTS